MGEDMQHYWSGHKVIDPVEIESRFSVEDGLGFMDATGNDVISDDSLEQLDRVHEILESLPCREADFVEMYFFRHMKQTDIAEIFQVSQPTVCYRLQRAAARIRFLLSLPEISSAEIREAMEGFLSDPLDVKIMLLMWETTCQSEVAKRLSVSQGLVRHRFIRSIDRMSRVPAMERYAKVFQMIAENLNILREVQRPSWGNKVSHVLL